MDPSPPEPSRPSSRNDFFHDATHERRLHQAGRSSTNLAAHAAIRNMREASRQSARSRPSSQVVTPDEVTNTANPALNSLVGLDKPLSPTFLQLANPAEALPTTSNNHQTTTPETESHAPSDSTSSTQSRKSDDTMVHSEASTTSLAPERAAGNGLNLLAMESNSVAGLRGPHPIRPLLPGRSELPSSNTLTRYHSPRSVRDLGADYTRYYNPFATRNNSQLDVSSSAFNSTTHLLPANGGVSPADLTSRLAGPFDGRRRRSDPFASIPGTPKPTSRGADREKGGFSTIATTRVPTPNGHKQFDPEKAGFFTYIDDRLNAPEYGFPLFGDEKEDDDDMHMPQWDDDIRYKPKLKDRFSRENITSILGLAFMVLGLLCVFVILPVVSYTGAGIIAYSYETPLGEFGDPNGPQAWATVNNRKYPLLKNIRTGLIDPDTPDDAKTRKGADGDDYVLVFSDEFNQPNRSFWPGDDPYWYATNFWYGATQDLDWYDPDAANTGDGVLFLQLDKFRNHNLDFRSGMLNSWNQLCFKGGIFEVSMSLPGPAGKHGWWPGVWTMGNLGKPGHLATTDGMWPYTYNDCDVGITPNQSMPDGTSHLPGQRLPSCTCRGEDHPTPGKGRGAPEIDIAEVSADWGGLDISVATQSFQVAPFDIWYYPNYEYMSTPNYSLSMVNTYTGGPFQQAISTTSMLNNNWFDGKQYQRYAFEYSPGSTKDSKIVWTIGDLEMMRFDARAVGPNGNIGQRLISEEPMSMIINFGFSENWVSIDWKDLTFPQVMRVDYVRWYQKPGEEMVTCDPPGYETTDYIAKHPIAYNNPNLTHWSETGYDWPKNSLMNGCESLSTEQHHKS